MTFLRNLGHDLVDKKLWPVAVLLVLGVIAVPFLLGGGEEPVATPVAAAPATGAAAIAPPAAAEVAVALEEPVLRKRTGRTRDPFKQQFAIPTKDGTVVSTVPGSSGVSPGVGSTGTKTPPSTSTGTGLGGSGGAPTPTPTPGGTGGAPTPAAPKATPPKLDPLDVYRVNLRFGEPGEQRTMRNIARLSPLPDSDLPFFVFLGVLSGGKKAVFLVGSDAVVTGDGTCRPSRANCETVEMAKGDTVFLDRETSEGITQYELDLLSVTRRTTVQAVAARKARALSSQKDRDQAAAKGEVAEELTDIYRWDADRGVLVRRKASRSTRSAVTTAPAEPVDAGPTAQDYRNWYIAVYLEYLRQLADGSAATAAVTEAALATRPRP